MSTVRSKKPARSRPKQPIGEPAWDLAHLYPAQGYWEEADYLELTESTQWLVELSDGFVEVLPMPTTTHQLILAYLLETLRAFVKRDKLGTALCAALRVRLWPRKFREPDIVFMFAKHAERMGEKFWEGADLVMEIVSGDPKDRERDLEIKRAEYARARIPEYWIVDPREATITVLRLSGKKYVVYGEFRRGNTATSALLKGFEVKVDEVFAAN